VEREIGENLARTTKEAKIAEQTRNMRVKIASENASARQGENEAKIIEEVSNSNLIVKQSEAMRLAQITKNDAEAAVVEAKARAETKAAIAFAGTVEAKKRAELEAPAKAQKAKTIIDAEAQAEVTQIIAKGDAEAMFKKIEAQARGERELLIKKAEGLKALVSSCGSAQETFQLLMLEHIDKLAETAAKAISNIKFDKITVWDSGANSAGPGATANFIKSLASSLPPTMHLVRDIAGVEMPQFFGKLASNDKTLLTKEFSDLVISITEKQLQAAARGDATAIQNAKDELKKLFEDRSKIVDATAESK